MLACEVWDVAPSCWKHPIESSSSSNWFTKVLKISIGVRIIKEFPGSVTSGTHCILLHVRYTVRFQALYNRSPPVARGHSRSETSSDTFVILVVWTDCVPFGTLSLHARWRYERCLVAVKTHRTYIPRTIGFMIENRARRDPNHTCPAGILSISLHFP